MKKEFMQMPEMFKENWLGEFSHFAWQDFLTAIPSVLFLITSYKKNGKENASMQAWSTFVGDAGEFICILGSVSKEGHLYQSLKETGCCVLNFPDRSIYEKCEGTIKNNQYEDEEITKSGLTAERAISVNAPRIKECFLNIECEFLWEHEHYENSKEVVIVLKAKHISMESDMWIEEVKGRYGKTGYMFNIHSPRNADNGATVNDCFGAIEKYIL
jgi:flavin reductase (DIM6/NTAB) family NADH-FMN oxidoreductase RutF